ncbi:hypothetical protein CFK39_09415 [Brachybacterium avium]|uniref:DUF4878 domain-containing protein n=1 Tax=Brachybacterium avium TaxID=2017485 RepID=A0A220UDC3_9MICO|nr:hypothetical protein [Brachybacterium avium]ASK66000.1 hypothetical protein CFK39_09415 [Brachybacterium avium]
MGERGRDRSRGRPLPLGWDEEAVPADLGASTSRPVPGPGGDGEAASAPASHGWSRLSRRSRRLIALGAVLVLVGGLLIALPRLLGAATGPEQVTREFLQAVVDGDLETVRAHTQDARGVSTAALTAEVLTGAEDRLDSFEIRHVAVEAGTATVTAALRTGTESREGTFTLTSSEVGAFSPTVWELAPVALPELQIDLTPGVQEIEIEGVTLPVEDLLMNREEHAPRIAVQLLPGTYDISVPQVTPWTEVPQRALEVPAAFEKSEISVHDLQLVLADDARAEVQRQADAMLEDCAASTSSIPEGCPFAAWGTQEDTPGTWTLTSSPRIESLPIAAFLWTLQGAGTAEFTPAGDAEPIEVPFTVSGTAAISGQGALQVSVPAEDSEHYGYCTDAENGYITGVVVLEEPGQDFSSECA